MTAKLVQSVNEQSLWRILKEQVACSLEPVAVDAFPSQPSASVDLSPPCIRSVETEPKADQRQRFVDDEIRRDQRLSRFERRVTCRARLDMSRVGAVGAGHPSSLAGEEPFLPPEPANWGRPPPDPGGRGGPGPSRGSWRTPARWAVRLVDRDDLKRRRRRLRSLNQGAPGAPSPTSGDRARNSHCLNL